MKYRIVQWLGRHVFPASGIRAHAHPDLTLLLHPRDWIEYLLLRGDRYEPLTLAFMAANLRPGDNAVLAGVNFGQHVLVAARSVGRDGRIVGIEPQPAALLRAAENLRLNDLAAQVTLVAGALGDHAGFLPMTWSQPENRGAASLFDHGDGLQVAVFRLDQAVATFCPRTPRLLLLDVQGFEPRVLAGLGATLRPDILIFECDQPSLAAGDRTIEHLLNVVTALGYDVKTLTGAGVTPAGDIPERNAVAVLPGRPVTWVAAAV